MNTINGGFMLYVKTGTPVDVGNNVITKKMAVNPGDTVIVPNPKGVEAGIFKVYDGLFPAQGVRWDATLQKADQSSIPLSSLPDGELNPGNYSVVPPGTPSPLLPTRDYNGVAAQFFHIPWEPGITHLTMVAKDAAGKTLGKEMFNVQGFYYE